MSWSWSYELERFLTQRRRGAEYAERFRAAFGRFSGGVCS